MVLVDFAEGGRRYGHLADHHVECSAMISTGKFVARNNKINEATGYIAA
jgi:hypothetical protein